MNPQFDEALLNLDGNIFTSVNANILFEYAFYNNYFCYDTIKENELFKTMFLNNPLLYVDQAQAVLDDANWHFYIFDKRNVKLPSENDMIAALKNMDTSILTRMNSNELFNYVVDYGYITYDELYEHTSDIYHVFFENNVLFDKKIAELVLIDMNWKNIDLY